MYVPRHFAHPDVEDLLRNHGAGDLVTPTAEGLVATMLPFVYDGTSLLGHVARNNDQWQTCTGEALVIVRGPDAYVSPSWYATKAEHGRVVPTWNYVTAHVYGELVVHDDAAFCEDVVRRLTVKHDDSWTVDDAPRAFVEGQLRAIVGVEVRITRVEAKAKLSQNRSAEDVAGVVAGYRALGDERMASLVENPVTAGNPAL